MNANKTIFAGWLVLLGIGCLVGLYAAVKLFMEGHWLFNANDVIIWSLPLGVYIFLALTSSGLTLLAGIPLVFGVRRYTPFAKRMVFLAIATLCGGFVSIALELGDILHMIYIFLSPNLSSPIWWMGTIYSVELVLLAVKFWRMHMGDWHSGLSRTAGVAAFFCALIAPFMIGSVFGITESRVTYFGPVMSIYCLLMALLSGTALFLLYGMIFNKVAGHPVTNLQATLYDEFGLILKYITGAVVVFTLVKLAIESATVVPEFLAIRKYEEVFGTILGIQTDIVIGLFVPFILLLIPGIRNTTGGKMIIAAMLWIGTLAMQMQILISGQSHPVGPKAEQFPEVLAYSPSVWEWLVFLFSVTVMLLLYTLGERYFKLEAVPES